MPQSKTITLQELANIFRQYHVISVHIYSADGASGMTFHFNSDSVSFYKAGNCIKTITITNGPASIDIKGPNVTIQYENIPTTSYAEISVVTHGLAFLVTLT